jgi:hypothetical protein
MSLLAWLRDSPTDPPAVRAWWLALIGLCLMLVAPLLLVDVPPLLDYPNHLARMVVLANPADPYLSRFYTPHWAIIPDLGVDLVLPPLLHGLPAHVAGRLMLAVIVLLPVLGTVAYSQAVFRRRTWWVLGVGLVAWNRTSLLGFLNFTATIGLGMLLAAAWIAWRERHPVGTFVLALLSAVGLFFCHLMGLICFALLIAPYEGLWLWRHRAAVSRVAGRLATAAAPFLIPIFLYASSPLGHLAGGAEFLSPTAKLAQLVAPFEGYVQWLDIVTVAGVSFALLIGRARATLLSGLTLGLLAVLFLVAPFGYQGVANLDTRFVVILGFLVFGGLVPALPRLGVLLLAALFIVRTSVLATAWAGHAVDLAHLRAAIAPVPPGSTVYLAAVSPEEAPEYWAHSPAARRLAFGLQLDSHMAALLPIERRAWWPFLFDNESQQPVATREPYRDLALRVGGIPDAAILPKADLCGFDYVLLLEAGGAQDLDRLMAGRLNLRIHNDFAALFQVDPDKCSGS